MCKKKKKIIQDHIYVIKQFVYVHRGAAISLFTEKKITKYDSSIFRSQNNIPSIFAMISLFTGKITPICLVAEA